MSKLIVRGSRTKIERLNYAVCYQTADKQVHLEYLCLTPEVTLFDALAEINYIGEVLIEELPLSFTR